jgi:uncharacterized membrane protein
MLSESTLQLPLGLALFQELVHGPSGEDLVRAILRWSHFVAGIAWIGLLYFFNLVNVPLMKALDAPTKGKVIPELMPRALWYFRWGAVVTVLVGLTYYAMYILAGDARAAGVNTWAQLGKWLIIVLITYAILYALYNVPALTKDGRILAVVIAILALLMIIAVVYIMGNTGGTPDALGNRKYLGNKTLSIGAGGGLGILMLLNVWGIIWPAQKRIIEATKAGTPAPADLARKAFLASRTNAWLSLPMLFFMGTSHGDWTLFGK